MLVLVLGWILYLARNSAVAVVIDLLPVALPLFGLGVLLSLVIVLRSARVHWPTIVVAIASLAGLGCSLWSLAAGVPSENVAFTSGSVELRGTVYSAKGGESLSGGRPRPWFGPGNPVGAPVLRALSGGERHHDAGF